MRVVLCLACLVAAACLTAAGPAPAPADANTPRPPTTATAPATTRPVPAAPSKELERKWRWYLITWNGQDIVSQSKADQQLVEALLKDDAYDVMALRKVMTAEYERQAGAMRRDEFVLGRIAARLAVAWTRAPADKQLTSPQLALYKKETCDGICHWALVSLRHFAGDIAEAHWRKYGGFLPGTAASMMSLIDGRGPYLDRPGDLRDELAKLRAGLTKLAAADPQRRDQYEQQFEKFFQIIESYDGLQAGKEAVLKVMADFKAAYNGRDDKAFAALWPEGHPATRFLMNRPLATKIEPALWTIVRWEPVYVLVKDNMAQAFVISQYRDKEGNLGGEQLQAFPAKRHEAQGWKLN